MMSDQRILVVDPDRLTVDALTRLLARPGIGVRGTADPDEARSILETAGADRMVLNAHMDAASGLLDMFRASSPEDRCVLLTERPHKLTAGSAIVVDRAHGIDYLIAALQLDPESGDGQVLLVHHQPERLAELRQMVLAAGFKAHGETTAAGAMGMIDRLPTLPVAIIDTELPDTRGLELLGALIHRPAHPEVIIANRFADREIGKLAIDLGAFDFIYEPFNASVIEGSLAAALCHRRYREKHSLWGQVLPRFLSRLRK
jgi:DNA-binding NtrC family response regulator